MFDRNNDGVGTGEEPWPLMLSGARDAANDYAVFSNQVRAREYCDRAGNNCFTAASVDDEEVSCQTVPYIRTSPVSFGGGGTVPCNWNDFSCMANYCQTTYGGWAGYHASALRVSGDSISSFSCHDWDTTSTCRTPTITNNTRPY
jgi:hypothetical protein